VRSPSNCQRRLSAALQEGMDNDGLSFDVFVGGQQQRLWRAFRSFVDARDGPAVMPAKCWMAPPMPQALYKSFCHPQELVFGEGNRRRVLRSATR